MNALQPLRLRALLPQAMPAFFLGTLVTLALLVATPAQAGLDATYLGTTAGAGGTTLFNYNLVFSPTLTDGSDSLIAGNYLTFYDVGPLTATSSPNFTFSAQNLGVTPTSFVAQVPDSPTILNATFTYTGATLTTATTFAVSLTSLVSTGVNGFYTSQVQYTSNTGGTGTESIFGGVVVPNAAAVPPGGAAPEPGSLALLLPVLGTVGMALRRHRKQ